VTCDTFKDECLVLKVIALGISFHFDCTGTREGSETNQRDSEWKDCFYRSPCLMIITIFSFYFFINLCPLKFEASFIRRHLFRLRRQKIYWLSLSNYLPTLNECYVNPLASLPCLHPETTHSVSTYTKDRIWTCVVNEW
jgi:hypothetical protein